MLGAYRTTEYAILDWCQVSCWGTTHIYSFKKDTTHFDKSCSWRLDQKPKDVCQSDNGLCYIMLVIDWCYTTPVYDTHAVVHLKVSKRLPAKDSPWCLSLSIDACVKLLCESVGCEDCHLFWSMAGTKILFIFGLYTWSREWKGTYIRTGWCVNRKCVCLCCVCTKCTYMNAVSETNVYSSNGSHNTLQRAPVREYITRPLEAHYCKVCKHGADWSRVSLFLLCEMADKAAQIKRSCSFVHGWKAAFVFRSPILLHRARGRTHNSHSPVFPPSLWFCPPPDWVQLGFGLVLLLSALVRSSSRPVTSLSSGQTFASGVRSLHLSAPRRAPYSASVGYPKPLPPSQTAPQLNCRWANNNRGTHYVFISIHNLHSATVYYLCPPLQLLIFVYVTLLELAALGHLHTVLSTQVILVQIAPPLPNYEGRVPLVQKTAVAPFQTEKIDVRLPNKY